MKGEAHQLTVLSAGSCLVNKLSSVWPKVMSELLSPNTAALQGRRR